MENKSNYKNKRLLENNNQELHEELNHPIAYINTKRSRLTSEPEINDITETKFACEFCNNMFANLSNLNHHIASFHMKNAKWTCSNCKKEFTNKSNLKVHLRVHTKVKPYHCKNCKYSCMHHSSIKDHIAKNHPGVIHSSLNPAYVFNSNVVPDPEQFNSETFNREAFIAEAQELNNKLSAQMSGLIESKKLKRDFKASSVDLSPISSNSVNLSDEASFSYEQSFSSVEDHLEAYAKKTDCKPKSISFSIDSIINDKSSQLQADSLNSAFSSPMLNPFNFYPLAAPQFDFRYLLGNTENIQNFYNYLYKVQTSK